MIGSQAAPVPPLPPQQKKLLASNNDVTTIDTVFG